MKTAVKLAIIAGMLAASYARAQVLPDAPSKTARAALLVLPVVEIGADAYFTNVNATTGKDRRELNPVARVFFTRGTPLRAGYFAAGAGLFVLVDRRLNRHHPRAARVLELGVIASEGYFLTYSATH